MSSTNVLASAPPAPGSETQHLYPSLPAQQDNFRSQKINEIAATLNHEVEHYRLFAKKYKKAQTVINLTAAGAGFLSTLFPSASLGSALTGIGLVASIPFGGTVGVFALSSAAMVEASKKIQSKISKHQEIVTLAVPKRDTVDRLMSQALKDEQVSDTEFNIILDELARYKALKEAVRSKIMKKAQQKKNKPISSRTSKKSKEKFTTRCVKNFKKAADSKPDLTK